MTPQEILALPMEGNEAGAATVREYLIALLATVWEQGEGFSGKRPFGDSGWKWELYEPLVAAGAVPGVMGEGGLIDEVDEAAAHVAIRDAIQVVTPAEPDPIVERERLRADAAERELRRANRILARLLQMGETWKKSETDAFAVAGESVVMVIRETP